MIYNKEFKNELIKIKEEIDIKIIKIKEQFLDNNIILDFDKFVFYENVLFFEMNNTDLVYFAYKDIKKRIKKKTALNYEQLVKNLNELALITYEKKDNIVKGEELGVILNIHIQYENLLYYAFPDYLEEYKKRFPKERIVLCELRRGTTKEKR